MDAALQEFHQGGGTLVLPAVIGAAGDDARRRYVEFFTVSIRNANTRRAYGRAVGDFLAWAEARGLALETITPVAVSAYIECHPSAPPTVKQHLAAIRMMFDYLVTGGVLRVNPAAPVRGPKYSVRRGKTPVLTAPETRELLDAIDITTVIGLRDRALIATMVYSFARVGAVTAMRVCDYRQKGKRWWLRLHEKGGKYHEVPVHHVAEEYLDAYIEAGGLEVSPLAPLWQTVAGRSGRLTGLALAPRDALAMVKGRAAACGLSREVCNHTFRATAITVYLQNGGTLEKAAQLAAHESTATTKLYDRRADELDLGEVERIVI